MNSVIEFLLFVVEILGSFFLEELGFVCVRSRLIRYDTVQVQSCTVQYHKKLM